MNVKFIKLTAPTNTIAEAFYRWENNPALIPLSRQNRNQDDLDRQQNVTVDELKARLKSHQIYLIYMDQELVGEVDFQIDPTHLFKKVTGTAWIGILIGEAIGRGKGIGGQAMQFLEEQIKGHGLKRIELGVFEFNEAAIKLYQNSGYIEIGRIKEFTFWKSKMWHDIRMEKYLQSL